MTSTVVIPHIHRCANVIAIVIVLTSISVPVISLELEEQTSCADLSQIQTDADHGNARAQLTLARLYNEGQCVTQDLKIGAKWLILSAKQDYAPAQGLMAALFYRDHRYEEAKQLSLPAAGKGDAISQSILGFLYQDGLGGLVKNDIEAAYWEKRAAEQGNGGAQATLAHMYYKGTGVTKDYIEADKWYIIAESNGYDDVEYKVLRSLIEWYRMSKQDVAEAHRRAKVWSPTLEPQLSN